MFEARELAFVEELCAGDGAGGGLGAGISATALKAYSPTAAASTRDKTLAERLIIVSLLCDTLVVLNALFFAFYIRFRTVLGDFGLTSPMAFSDYTGYLILGTLTLVGCLAYFGAYDRHSLLRHRHVSLMVTKATCVWFAGFLALALTFQFKPPISRIFVGLTGANALLGLLFWRGIFHRYLRRSSVATALRQRVLFVDWSEEGTRLLRTFQNDHAGVHEVIGCVSSAKSHFEQQPPPEVAILGFYDEIAKLLAEHEIDIVILAEVSCLKDDVVALANLCEKAMVQFKVIPSYFQILVSGLHLETVSGIPILGVTRLPLNGMLNVIAKRLVDIIGATVGLMLSAPLIAISGALVYLESPGPIFYRQRRLGQNGTIFQIIKIRSMRLDAEKNGASRAVKDDPRRLRIGSILRRWNLDELPQFWNVLKGDMSLVGPRPEILELTVDLKEEIPHYSARHNIKPGMTGWAQIKGMRGDTDLCERIKCDLFYLENWTLLLDFQIMMLTFLTQKNAI
jgi:exopolysaccharide biosynthesis polyprenyl glycosylphosphotransferase